MDIQSFMMEFITFVPQVVVGFWSTLILVLTVIVHFVFGYGVYVDALRLFKRGRRLFFVKPRIWFFATLIGGVFVAGIYWVLHHSRLNPSIELQQMQNDERDNQIEV